MSTHDESCIKKVASLFFVATSVLTRTELKKNKIRTKIIEKK